MMSEVDLSIKSVAEQTGVSVHTLRQWERRYGVPAPARAGNRYRRYDGTDIADVLTLKRQIESGISPAQAGASLRQQRQTRGSIVSGLASDSPLTAHQTALETAFFRSDESAARQILDEAFALFSLDQVTLQIIQPAMETLGANWMKGELTIAQEHFASNLVRQKLIALIQAQGAATAAASLHMVAASAPDEEHELGLLILVLLALHQGWRVTYLGQRTPLAEMTHHAEEHQADAIVISVTTVLGLASLIPWFMKTSRPNLPVGLGGRLLNTVPHLRDHLPGFFLGEDIVISLRTLTAYQPERKLWAPSRKSLKAAMMLREFRLKIASETVTQLAEGTSAWGFGCEPLMQRTLYLLDTLACAIAYDAPELMDAQNEWLGQAMSPRRIHPHMITKHLQVFKRTVEKNLGKDRVPALDELLDRLQN